MENETLKKDGKNETGTNVGNQEERTWTQSQLEAIVQERLDRERAKYSDYEDMKAKAQKYDEAEEANKSELEKATEKAVALQNELDAMKKADRIRAIKAKAAEETGVPASLLHGEDEETCKAEAQAILAFASQKSGYPTANDGGETHKPTLSKADILAIKDERQRLKAIQDNIELFK